MVMSEQLTTALAGAEEVLNRYDLLSKAITEGVDGLQPLIANRLSSEKQLRLALVAEAVEGAKEGAGQAKKGVASAKAALSEAGARLRALRGAQTELGGQLSAAHEGLAREMPTYCNDLSREFASEWDEAVSAFNLVLARRQALESLLGRKLQLSDPTAASSTPVDLGDRGRPAQVLASLKGKLLELKFVGEMAEWHAVHPVGWIAHPFDSGAVHTLLKPQPKFPGSPPLPAGTRVVEASFGVNGLAKLAHLGEAMVTEDPGEASGLMAAEAGLKVIDKAQQAETERRRREEQAALDAMPPQQGPSKTRDQQFVRPLPEDQDGAKPVEFVDAHSGRPSPPPNVR